METTQLSDPRVRAAAVEALWQQTPSAEVRSMLQSAVSDPHHRVVTNALVGLYRLGDPEALPSLIDLATHRDPLFRAACAWSLGFIADPLGKPTLQDLRRDSSNIVRKRAAKALLQLESAMRHGPEAFAASAAILR